jgi:hypothetical protein
MRPDGFPVVNGFWLGVALGIQRLLVDHQLPFDLHLRGTDEWRTSLQAVGAVAGEPRSTAPQSHRARHRRERFDVVGFVRERRANRSPTPPRFFRLAAMRPTRSYTVRNVDRRPAAASAMTRYRRAPGQARVRIIGRSFEEFRRSLACRRRGRDRDIVEANVVDAGRRLRAATASVRR